MKNFHYLIYLVFFSAQLGAQTINFTDVNFKNTLLSSGPDSSVAWDNNNTRIAIDVNFDGEIQQSEALLVYRLQLGNAGIQDVSGIEFFTNVSKLLLSGNPITDLDVTFLTGLEELTIHQSNFANVNFTNLSNLKTIYAYGNPISNFDFTGVTALEKLVIGYNSFTNLDVTMLANLQELTVYDNVLTSLDLSNLLMLETLFISHTQLISLEIDTLINLKNLTIQSSQLSTIDASNLTNLEALYVHNSNLTALTLSNNSSLTGLGAVGNLLTTIDLSQAPNLTGLNLYDNQFTTLDLTLLTNLGNLVLDNNQLSVIDVSTNDNISGISATNNNLQSLDLSNLTDLIIMDVDNNNLTELNIQNTVLAQEVDNHFFDGNPDLINICVDQGELAFIQQRVADYGYVNANVSVCSLGIAENIEGKINIYPNPAKGLLNIKLENNIVVNSLSVYSIQGEEVLTKRRNFETINTSAMQIGFYLLKIETNKGTVFKRFIKS